MRFVYDGDDILEQTNYLFTFIAFKYLVDALFENIQPREATSMIS